MSLLITSLELLSTKTRELAFCFHVQSAHLPYKHSDLLSLVWGVQVTDLLHVGKVFEYLPEAYDEQTIGKAQI